MKKKPRQTPHRRFGVKEGEKYHVIQDKSYVQQSHTLMMKRRDMLTGTKMKKPKSKL